MSENNMSPVQNVGLQTQQIPPAIPKYPTKVASAARAFGVFGCLQIPLSILAIKLLSPGMAIVALFFVILSFPLSILAIIFGAIGISKARRRENTLILNNQWDTSINTGKGLAITGLIMGIILIIITPIMCALVVPLLYTD